MFDWFFNIVQVSANKLANTRCVKLARIVSPIKKAAKVSKVAAESTKKSSPRSSVTKQEEALEKLLSNGATFLGHSVNEAVNDILQNMYSGSSSGKENADGSTSTSTPSTLVVPTKFKLLEESSSDPLGWDAMQLDQYLLAYYLLHSFDKPKYEKKFLEDANKDPELAYADFINTVPKLINTHPENNKALNNLLTAYRAYKKETAGQTESLTEYEGGDADRDESARALPEQLTEAPVAESVSEKDEEEKRKKRYRRILRQISNTYADKPAIKQAFTALMKNTYDAAVANTSAADAVKISELPADIRKHVEPFVSEGSNKNIKDKFTEFLNNSLVKAPTLLQESVTLSDLQAMKQAAIDARNLLSEGLGARNSHISSKNLKERLDLLDKKIENYINVDKKDEAFIDAYKKSAHYNQIKNLVEQLGEDDTVPAPAGDATSAKALKEKLNRDVKLYSDAVYKQTKFASKRGISSFLNSISDARAQALNALSNSDLSEGEKAYAKKVVQAEFSDATHDVMNTYTGAMLSGMEKAVPESEMSKYMAQLLSTVSLDQHARSAEFYRPSVSYNQYVDAVHRFAQVTKQDVVELEEGAEIPTEVDDLSDALYAIYEDPSQAVALSTKIPGKQLEYFLHLLLSGAGKEDRAAIEKETGLPFPVHFFDEATALESFNEGSLRSLEDPVSGLRVEIDRLQKQKTWVDKKASEYSKRLNNFSELHEKLSKQELSDLVKRYTDRSEYIATRISELSAEVKREDPKSAAKQGIKDVKEVKDSDIHLAYPDIPVVNVDGYWFKVKENPLTGKKEISRGTVSEPVIIDPIVYESDGEFYLHGSESEYFYKLEGKTGNISDYPRTGIDGEKVGTYKAWLHQGVSTRLSPNFARSLHSEPNRSKEILLRVYDKPEEEVSLAVKTALLDNFTDDSDILREFAKELTTSKLPAELAELIQSALSKGREQTPVVEKEVAEDIVTPTKEEEDITEKAGFIFGIHRTASFFKFAASEDNYEDMNVDEEVSEQKQIESPGSEEFSYNAQEATNTLLEDTQLSEEFSMEKLGKVLKVIKSESSEKWDEIVDLVRQSSAKSGDALSVFLQLFANNNWNGEAALRAYNAEAITPRNRSYFWSMFKRNVWPQLQSNPAIVNVVKSLNKNEAVTEEDVNTSEYKHG